MGFKTTKQAIRYAIHKMDQQEVRCTEKSNRSSAVGMSGGECSYRNPSGQRCIVGWMMDEASINDLTRNGKQAGAAVASWTDRDFNLIAPDARDWKNILIRLQELHDDLWDESSEFTDIVILKLTHQQKHRIYG